MKIKQRAEKIYNIGYINKAVDTSEIDTLEEMSNMDVLYKSSVITVREAEKILHDNTIEDYREEFDPKLGERYYLIGRFDLEERFRLGTWQILVKTTIGMRSISGSTSPKNWYSQSKMNNLINVGFWEGRAYFYVLNLTETTANIQFLILEDYKRC